MRHVSGFLPGIFFERGGKIIIIIIIVMQVSFVMLIFLLFLDQISGGRVFPSGGTGDSHITTLSPSRTCPPTKISGKQ